MKIKYVPLLLLPFLSSCFLIPKHLHLGFDIESLSDQDILMAAQKKKYHFDEMYRINDVYSFTHLVEYGLNAIKFVNLYDPSGNLLRSNSGTHCEIQLMAFLKDSLKLKEYRLSNCDSCNYHIIVKEKCHLISSRSAHDTAGVYRVVIGWSCFANRRNMFSQRVYYINEMIPELKRKNINILVMGLNLDPPLDDNGR